MSEWVSITTLCCTKSNNPLSLAIILIVKLQCNSIILILEWNCVLDAVCPPLHVHQDVTVIPPTCTSTKMRAGDVCSFSCNDGFRVHGPPMKECMDGGAWTNQHMNISCTGIQSLVLLSVCLYFKPLVPIYVSVYPNMYFRLYVILGNPGEIFCRSFLRVRNDQQKITPGFPSMSIRLISLRRIMPSNHFV